MGDTKVIDSLSSLLERCAGGDQEAFAHLYRTSAPKLFALAMSVLGREEWAEETLQAGFLKIWHHANTFDPNKSSAMTWMASIVRYHALDVLRRSRHEIPLDNERNRSLRWDDSANLRSETFQTQESYALQICLEKLPEEQRQSILLAYFHGLTHRELADTMDAPLGTVKAWIRRGLQHIRGCLDYEL